MSAQTTKGMNALPLTSTRRGYVEEHSFLEEEEVRDQKQYSGSKYLTGSGFRAAFKGFGFDIRQV